MLNATHINEQEFDQLRNVSRSLALLLSLLETLVGSNCGASLAAADLVAMLRVHLPVLEGVMGASQTRRDEGNVAPSDPLHTGALGAALAVTASQAARLPSAKEDIFELGAWLLLEKQKCPHGKWKEHLSKLGLTYAYACIAMHATRLFKHPDKVRTDKLLSLGSSKLRQMLVLGDELITKIDAGESVYGLTLDAIEGMTLRQLCVAVIKVQMQRRDEGAVIPRGNRRKVVPINAVPRKAPVSNSAE